MLQKRSVMLQESTPDVFFRYNYFGGNNKMINFVGEEQDENNSASLTGKL